MTDRLILTRLLNATEEKQTHYINNKTIRTGNVDFVQSVYIVDFDVFDVAFEWISSVDFVDFDF